MVEKFNKGEWSELYAFAKIISDKNLKGADQNLDPIPGENYPVYKIIRNSKKTKRTYDLNDQDNVRISVKHDGLVEEEYIVPYSQIEETTPIILDKLTSKRSKKKGEAAFLLPAASKLAKILNAGKIKAKSTKKGDIQIVIHDKITSLPSTVEFSIKSYLGEPPTLLNASQGTNFIYQVVGFGGKLDDVNSIDTGRKVMDRLKMISEGNGELEFSDLESDVFISNLRKIDTMMPAFLAEFLFAFNSGKGSKLSDLTKIVANSPKIRSVAGYDIDASDLEYKIKQLLINIALGMVPKTKWDGFLKADGGYIVVKQDGEVVCFHIYNISDLGEYLFNNTQLQNHSTSRQKFGTLYIDGNKTLFKLNLNIRFTKFGK